jgi:cobalt/nickel transport system permease protein
MHIPDGFLSDPVCTATTVASLAGVTLAAVGVRRVWNTPATTPTASLTAAVAAAIFAGQMMNFPIASGTSGHLIGATLATVLLGWPRAVLVMTGVLAVQCLLFADGGLFALGANVFNMSLIAVGVSATVFHFFGRGSATVALAGWLSVMAAATACAVQLAVSRSAPWSDSLMAMLSVHAVIGVGEAALTVAVWLVVERGLTQLTPQKKSVSLMGAALVIAGLCAPFASSSPDGLEHVAEQLGFADRATAGLATLLPDYAVPAIEPAAISTAVAGVVGTLVVFAAGLLIARLGKSSLKL